MAALYIPRRRRKLPGSAEKAARSREIAAIRIQSFVGVLALAISVPGLWLGAITYREQQKINRSQLEINQSQMQLNQLGLRRFERRYASRVAYWDEDDSDTDDDDFITRINLQNRSPVPLTEVSLSFAVHMTYGVDLPGDQPGGAVVAIGLDAVPPCTLVTIPVSFKSLLRPLEEKSGVTIERGATIEWVTDVVAFSDPSGKWALRGSDLAKWDEQFESEDHRQLSMQDVRAWPDPWPHVEGMTLSSVLRVPNEDLTVFSYQGETLAWGDLPKTEVQPLSDCGESG